MRSGVAGLRYKSKVRSAVKILGVLTVIILSVWAQGQPARINAGIGNHNDYSSGSDSSWGGSSWDSSSDNDAFVTDGPWMFIIFFFGILLFGFINAVRSKFNKENAWPYSGSTSYYNTAANDRTREIAEKIQEYDPDFSAPRFIEWAKEGYVQLQRAWSLRDWKLARPFESDSLFKLHQIQVQEYIDTGRINRLENICVNTAYLTKHEIEGGYEFLTLRMSVRLNDWQIDENTGAVVKGDPAVTYRLTYDLKFMRSAGTLTNTEKSNKSTTNCPNCGAPTDITSSGQCRYCDSVITTGKHDWVLCEVNGVK